MHNYCMLLQQMQFLNEFRALLLVVVVVVNGNENGVDVAGTLSRHNQGGLHLDMILLFAACTLLFCFCVLLLIAVVG